MESSLSAPMTSGTGATSRSLADSTHALLATSYPFRRAQVFTMWGQSPDNRALPSLCRDPAFKTSDPKENRSNWCERTLRTTRSRGRHDASRSADGLTDTGNSQARFKRSDRAATRVDPLRCWEPNQSSNTLFCEYFAKERPETVT